MKKIISRALVLFVTVGFLVVTADCCFAAEGNATYKTNIIKGRAERDYTSSGTKIYNYNEVKKYNDNIGNEYIGNLLDVKSNVREIHNATVIKNGVKSKKKDLDIGKVVVEKPHRSLDVENLLIIKGDVKAASAKDIELGTVGMGRNGSGKKAVDTNVQVKGGINGR